MLIVADLILYFVVMVFFGVLVMNMMVTVVTVVTVVVVVMIVIYNDDNDEKVNFKLQRRNSGIYKIQCKKNNTFKLFIDQKKLMCKADLEKAIILGYELIYYSVKLIKHLELNQYDYFEDFTNLCEWASKDKYPSLKSSCDFRKRLLYLKKVVRGSAL